MSIISIIIIQKEDNYILWQHLVALYNRDRGKGTGLSLVPKLKFEHISLNSFSKMRVDLATQVAICYCAAFKYY